MSHLSQLVAAGSALLGTAGLLSGCVQPARITAAPPASTTTLVPGCPPVVLEPSRHVVIDFTDFVVHRGVTYSALVDAPAASTTVTPGQLGPELFRVTCTFSTLNTRTQVELPEPTEHSAGYLPAQSPVFAVVGWPASCRLAARHDGRWVVYVAGLDTAATSTFDECGLEKDRQVDPTRS